MVSSPALRKQAGAGDGIRGDEKVLVGRVGRT
jgi:hypothetical protein